MSVTDRRTRQKAEVRQRILDAARQIAREKDWNAVTIRSIAEAIDYTPPIVYEHFANKEDVLMTIVKAGHDENRRAFDEILAMELSANEKIVRLSMENWRFAHDRPEIYRLMHNPDRIEQHRDMIFEGMAETKHKIEGLFGEVYSDFETVGEVIFSWFCMMQGYINLITNIQPQQGAKLLEKVEDPNMVALFKKPDMLFERAIRRFIQSIATPPFPSLEPSIST
ncbi:TetR/AcrR family transcriptional regulator [Spirosoma oryzicola]|uniref:TetR/AcrR family transcriptional regulator n=1 Tax=Spirosoma oryzicola TaxID=2898794 RepID=UPI001E4B5163|nr:TetR/AcrR family transcriptional regulator [Spirosoma oryzicola]UHG92011.1 TetR/AcrR family transcriptional regulator [Spirosoma oryzicola]